MYTVETLPARHRLAYVPIEMPVDYALALPPYVTDDPAQPIFNLPLAIQELLGEEEWQREKRIIVPYVWAPDLTELQLNDFVLNPFRAGLAFGPPPPPIPLQEDFPGMGRLAFPGTADYHQFEIVHFVGRVLQLPDEEYALDLGSPLSLSATYLQAALQAAQTRLIIFQTDSRSDFARAIRLGHHLVERGGPAALVVAADSPDLLRSFYASLLADLVHNSLLENLENSYFATLPEVEFWLVAGEGSRELFKFDRYRLAINERFGEVQNSLDSSQQYLEQFIQGHQSYLHGEQRARLLAMASEAEPLASLRAGLLPVEQNLTSAAEPWEHESGGAIPLAEAVRSLEALELAAPEARQRYEAALRAELDQELREAPRVLNANFADPRQAAFLQPNAALEAGQEYDLLVDVGPRWNRIPSIVSGQSEFPEYALPADEEGYLIQLTMVSRDFSPPIASATMWVPRHSGRSYPFANGKRANEPGPVSLRLQAPAFPKRRKRPLIARARLNLYYEGNLLQSALITAGVARESGVEQAQPNAVEVDYVLSGSFQDVEEHFAARALTIGESQSLPVSFSVTMNDTGKGHLFVYRSRSNGPAANGDACEQAWLPYDASAADRDLSQARQGLLDCFFLRDKQTGEVVREDGEPVYGLRENNGKTREQFKLDLYRMALLGSRLRAKMFTRPGIQTADECERNAWRDQLWATLKQSSVIQVAHAGNAHYVFPWSMIYEHPLNISENIQPGDWRYCDIINEEWSSEGVRQASAQERMVCKYHAEPWHGKNVICPYGFWGFKHLIEEPLSLHRAGSDRRLSNKEKEVRIVGAMTLAVALTADAQLRQEKIEEHIQNLAAQGAELVPITPAQDWNSARALLRAPEIVYFLCHGEYDEEEQDDYLSIGPRNDSLLHRIYNINTLAQWRDDNTADGPDAASWRQRGPLVFINGCHTADLTPGKVVSFATTFTDLGARGILGTEISVDLPVAIEFAESFFQKIAPPRCMPMGEALYRVRWELLNKGNLLGLAYTLYGLADLKLARESD